MPLWEGCVLKEGGVPFRRCVLAEGVSLLEGACLWRRHDLVGGVCP